jgi:hypothetical protein
VRLKDVAKGTWAVKTVPLRLANTVEAAQPGQPPSSEPTTIPVGVRALTGDETALVYQKAEVDARAKGVTTWSDEHPLCHLYVMVHTLAVAVVDADSPHAAPVPFFNGAEHVLSSPLICTDNIAYLYERQQDWQDECSIETKSMTVDQVIGTLLEEADRPENADSPLERMRPGLRRSFLHTTAVLFATLQRARLGSGLLGDSSITTDTSGSAPEAEPTH